MPKKIDVYQAAEVVEEIIDALVGSAGHNLAAFPPLTVNVADGDCRAGAERTINRAELASLYALLAYTADEQAVRQETVQAIVEAELNVRHLGAVKARDFRRAVSFIGGLRVGAHAN